MSLYFMTLILFCVGVYALVVKKNLVKKIIGLVIVENAVNLFFILIGFRSDGEAPILERGMEDVMFVDPLPQAMILTSIVIGLGVVALLVAISVRIYEKYGTFDISEIRELRG